MKRKILYLLIIATLAFIWGHSMAARDLSSEESGRIFKLLYPILTRILPDSMVTDHLVRKCAHFTEYTVLGMELSGLFTIKGRRRLFRDGMVFLPAFFTGFLVAFIDETIQIFSGRGPMIADVWLDSLGVFTGALIITLIRTIKN